MKIFIFFIASINSLIVSSEIFLNSDLIILKLTALFSNANLVISKNFSGTGTLCFSLIKKSFFSSSKIVMFLAISY